MRIGPCAPAANLTSRHETLLWRAPCDELHRCLGREEPMDERAVESTMVIPQVPRRARASVAGPLLAALLADCASQAGSRPVATSAAPTMTPLASAPATASPTPSSASATPAFGADPPP